ncbi:HDIG domain-containing metalloprotein [Caloramator australicus]|uniref:HDIG domain protein n=1 Tax=Caloramator australicus RC3 TaxID=857293 RepID=I7LIH5_9CLOT|nr:HDIG domain-containing metalloprotein [Caloramator australicus]CCJ32977.1 HDIG domain protein [Caloramator australicus RC3]
MDRSLALLQVRERVKNENLIKHMLAVEAVMKSLARKLGEDELKWGICGLVHDIDYEETYETPEKHSIIGAEILQNLGYPDDLVYAVKVHNEVHGLPRVSLLDKALWASDPVTGLIIASALVLPDKKLESLTVDSVIKKMKKKDFAKGANREQIKSIEEIGISLEEFLSLSIDAMKEIANELGL